MSAKQNEAITVTEIQTSISDFDYKSKEGITAGEEN